MKWTRQIRLFKDCQLPTKALNVSPLKLSRGERQPVIELPYLVARTEGNEYLTSMHTLLICYRWGPWAMECATLS